MYVQTFISNYKYIWNKFNWIGLTYFCFFITKNKGMHKSMNGFNTKRLHSQCLYKVF